MRKKALIVVALLLALSVAMASMAFTSATLTNPASLKISSTDQALVALEPNPNWDWTDKVGMKDGTSALKDGTLFFQFGKGISGAPGNAPVFWGLQPNSSYEWAPLFGLRNKSAETLQITIKCTGDFAQYVTLGTAGSNHIATWGTKGQPFVFDTVTKETENGLQNYRTVAVKIDLPAGVSFSQAELAGSIIVSAVAK